MLKRITVAQLVRTAQRGVVVAMLGLLLAALAVPETSLAAQIGPHAQAITHLSHPNPSGDSPVMP
jgi:hypothetical protein